MNAGNIRYSRAPLLQAAMIKKRPNGVWPTEAELAAPSLSGLNLDNLEDRVEELRHASAPTRVARAKTNRASREAQVLRKKAADFETAKRQPK